MACGLEDRRAVFVFQHVGGGACDNAETGGLCIRAGDDGDDARRRLRILHIDAGDARMGMRGAHHAGMGLTGQRYVVGKASLA